VVILRREKEYEYEEEKPFESIEGEGKEEYLPSDGNVYAAELIAAYKGGDKGAFGKLCRIYWGWMKTKNYFYYDKNDQKAEEATDDQLMIISDNILDGRYVEQMKFEGYIRNVVRNNHKKDPKELKTVEFNENAQYNDGEAKWDEVLFDVGDAFVLDRNEGDDLDYERMAGGHDFFKVADPDDANSVLMFAAIATLPKDDRDIIEMRDLHGMSYKLIGGIFNLSENSVSGRRDKILKKILGIEKIVLESGRIFKGKDIIVVEGRLGGNYKLKE
jgi:RNA polymerase sigma factor (sigma-70 family)